MLDMGLYAMGEPRVTAVSGVTYDRLGQKFVTELYGEDAVYEVEDFAAHRGREGLLRTWIIDAIYRSAEEGREILLEELEDEL